MNNRHLRGGVAFGAALLFAVSAHAQSSVTLYGVLDVGIDYVHNASSTAYSTANGNAVKLGSGNTYGSRWGLKGTEDLGGGLATVFQLESGFSLSNGTSGQGGLLFGRKAIVGLTSKTYGAVTLGRQYDPVVDLVQNYTEDAYFGGTFGTPGDLDNYDNTVRINNSVKYASPVISGFQFEAIYGLGGVAGSTGSGQTYGAAVAYATGPLGLAAGVVHSDAVTTSSPPAWTGSNTGALFQTVINEGFATAKSWTSARASGQYQIGAFTAGAAYSYTEFVPGNGSLFDRTAKFNNGSVFVNYRVVPALLLGAGYNYTLLTGPAHANYNQFNFGADYALSKRTSLYALIGYQKANGTTLNAAGKTVAAQASVGDLGVNSGTDSQLITSVGIRSRF